MKTSRYTANFDSSSAMVRAAAGFLSGKGFPLLGLYPAAWQPALSALTGLLNRLPLSIRKELYTWGGWAEALPPEKLGQVRLESISARHVQKYPKRKYPGALIGSSNGAAIHLGAALGLPFLPQTDLIAVRRSLPIDEPERDLEWGKKHGKLLLDNNPDLALHQMYDPNQDRLMVRRMAYFRVKRIRLGKTYRDFLSQNLEEGASLFVIDCGQRWPCVRVQTRHCFQLGGQGGISAEEYLTENQRVREFLSRAGSDKQAWNRISPDSDAPEAEWGFAPELLEDIKDLAGERGWRVVRIRFEPPDGLSPWVADLYRWWYRKNGLEARRLFVESFIILEPSLVLEKKLVPFWTIFPVEAALQQAERYVASRGNFEEIWVALFANGVKGAGYASADRWKSLIGRARSGGFIGVDAKRFPNDLRVYARYHQDLQNLPSDGSRPAAFNFTALQEFQAENRGSGVRFQAA